MKSFVVLIGLITVLIMMGSASAQDLSAEELRQLGRQSFAAGKYHEAEQFLGLAVQKFASRNGVVGEDIVGTLRDLSTVLISQQRYIEVEPLLIRTLGILKTSSSLDQRHTPIMLGNPAATYQQTGRFQLAERTYKEAFQAVEKYLGPDAPYKAALLSNFAAFYGQTGKDKLAEKNLKTALELVEKQFGKESPELAPILTNLAALNERRKKWAVAESLLVRTLALIENSLGRDHPDVSLVLEHLGVVHFRQNKIQQAGLEFRRALEIERMTDRAEGIRIANLSFHLARVLSAEGNYDEARTLYTETLDRQERILGLRAPEVAATLEQYAKLLQKAKSDALARQMEARARQIRAELALTVRIER